MKNVVTLEWENKSPVSTLSRYDIYRMEGEHDTHNSIVHTSVPPTTKMFEEYVDYGKTYTYFIEPVTIRGKALSPNIIVVHSNTRFIKEPRIIAVKSYSDDSVRPLAPTHDIRMRYIYHDRPFYEFESLDTNPFEDSTCEFYLPLMSNTDDFVHDTPLATAIAPEFDSIDNTDVLRLDGSQYVNLDTFNTSYTRSHQEFSVSLWVYLNAPNTGENTIFKFGGQTNGYQLLEVGGDVTLAIVERGYRQHVGTPLPYNQWVFVTTTYNPRKSNAKLYVDGNHVDTINGKFTDGSDGHGIGGNGHQSSYSGSEVLNNLVGYVSHFRYFSRELSLEEINILRDFGRH